MLELLYGKKVSLFNPVSKTFENAEVICHYGEYSEICHRICGGLKETWNYPNLIDVRFEDGTVSHGHFVHPYLMELFGD